VITSSPLRRAVCGLVDYTGKACQVSHSELVKESASGEPFTLRDGFDGKQIPHIRSE